MRRHIHPIEARLLHCTRQFQRTVLQYDTFLDVLIHLRSGGIVDAHIVEQGARLQYIHRKRGFLAGLVRPVLVVGLHRHHNMIPAYLCR